MVYWTFSNIDKFRHYLIQKIGHLLHLFNRVVQLQFHLFGNPFPI